MSEYKDVFDCYGRIIEVNDVLKVYHFTDRRYRKKHYMYKLVSKHPENEKYLIGVSIGDESGHHYYLTSARDDGIIEGTEIVQSNNFDKLYRKPRKPTYRM